MKRLSVAFVFLAANAFGSVPLFDFETAAECKAAPRLSRKTYGFGVTNLCATSGRNAFCLYASKWEAGDYEWPAFTMNTKINDWSGYDRLVFDVVNLGVMVAQEEYIAAAIESGADAIVVSSLYGQ